MINERLNFYSQLTAKAFCNHKYVASLRNVKYKLK